MSDSKVNDAQSLVTDLQSGRMSRREFVKGAVALGMTAALANTLSISVAQAATPKRGGRMTLAMGHGSTNDNLDPALIENGWQWTAMFGICNTLIELSAKGDLVPSLAESWESSADLKTWRLNIRQGIEFHDGRKLTPIRGRWRSSSGDRRCRRSVAEGEGGCTREAHDQSQGVEQQPEEDRLSGSDAERAEEQHKSSLTYPETRYRQRNHLDDEYEWNHGEPTDESDLDADGVTGDGGGCHKGDLVDGGDKKDLAALLWMSSQATQPEMHSAEELPGTAVAENPPSYLGMFRGPQDQHQQAQRNDGDDEGEPCPLTEKTGAESETDECEQRQHHPSAEAFDGHRSEHGGGVAGLAPESAKHSWCRPGWKEDV